MDKVCVKCGRYMTRHEDGSYTCDHCMVEAVKVKRQMWEDGLPLPKDEVVMEEKTKMFHELYYPWFIDRYGSSKTKTFSDEEYFNLTEAALSGFLAAWDYQQRIIDDVKRTHENCYTVSRG